MRVAAQARPARVRGRGLPGGPAGAILRAPVTARAWRELAYCVVGLALACAGFAVVLILLVAGSALTISVAGTVVGLLLLYGTLVLARTVGALHRRLAAVLLGEQVAAPPAFRPGTGFLGRLEARLRDAAGWRAAAYLLLKLPVAVLGAMVAAYLWIYGLFMLTYPVWWAILHRLPYRVHGVTRPNPVAAPLPWGGLHVATLAGAFVIVPIGVALVLAAPWGVRAVVTADRSLIRSLLGPGSLRARVRFLEQARAHAVDDSAATLRRVERDLHDGAQARLAALALSLGLAKEKLGDDGPPADVDRARELVDSAHRSAKEALAELRDLARGIHPPALDAGLADALATLTARSAVPVAVAVDLPVRPTPAIETIAYFCAAELLANAIKHSAARQVVIEAAEPGGKLRLRVADDGTGGADPGGGTGLRGLADRVRTVDGRLEVTSPAGGPTVITVELPLHA